MADKSAPTDARTPLHQRRRASVGYFLPFVILIASQGFYAADLISWDTTASTRFDGIAKPTPFAGVLDSVLTAVNVGMPMNSPCKLTRAPPLLPGLMGASVWMALEIVVPADSVTLRFSALIMPSVAVSVIPSGLPIASTSWPTVSFDELPICATVIWANGGMRTTARSSAGSFPTSRACNVVPLLRTTS